MNEVLPRWNIIYNGNCRFKIGVYLAYKPPVVKISLFGVSRAALSRQVSLVGTSRISFFFIICTKENQSIVPIFRDKQIKLKKTYDNVLTKGMGW